MKLRTSFSFLVLLAGCAAKSTSAGSADQASTSDIVSAVARGDGTFDVTCRDEGGGANYTETVDAAHLSAPSICAGAPASPLVTMPGFHVGSVNGDVGATGWPVSRPNTPDVWFNAYTWADDIWEGNLSFRVTPGSGSTCAYVVRDGKNALYDVHGATRFDRLVAPVAIYASNSEPSCSTDFAVDNVALEVGYTKQPLLVIGDGDFAFDTDAHLLMPWTSPNKIPSVGVSLGATLTFTATATFNKTFDNGNACESLIVKDAAGLQLTLTPSASTQTASLALPLSIYSRATCSATRLPVPSGQVDDGDFALSFSAMTIDNRPVALP